MVPCFPKQIRELGRQTVPMFPGTERPSFPRPVLVEGARLAGNRKGVASGFGAGV